MEWMARDRMADDLVDEKYNQEKYRFEHLEHVLHVIKRWTLTHTAAALFEFGQAVRSPWAPVLSPREVLDTVQLKERGFFVPLDQSTFGTNMPVPGIPYRFSSFAFRYRKRAPFVGEANRLVYQGELGLSQKEMERLSLLNVI